jgi:hypothetical protein
MSEFEDVVLIEEKNNKGHWDPEQEVVKVEKEEWNSLVSFIEKNIKKDAKDHPRLKDIVKSADTIEELMERYTIWKREKRQRRRTNASPRPMRS